MLQRSSNNSIEGFGPTSSTMLHKSLSFRTSSGGGANPAAKGGTSRIRCTSMSSLNSDSVITDSRVTSSGGSSTASQRAGSRRQILTWGLLVMLMLATIGGIAVAAWVGGRQALMPQPAAVLLAPSVPSVLPALPPSFGYQVSVVLPSREGVGCGTWFPGAKVRGRGWSCSGGVYVVIIFAARVHYCMPHAPWIETSLVPWFYDEPGLQRTCNCPGWRNCYACCLAFAASSIIIPLCRHAPLAVILLI
jgi:hypothetical protein